jgi:WD40 repeat protein
MSGEDEYIEVEIDDMDDRSSVSDSNDMLDEEDGIDTNDTSFFSAQLADSALCLAVSAVNPLTFCVGCLDNSARIITVDAAGSPTDSFELLGHSDSVASVSFSSNGSFIATGSYDSSIKLWSVEDGKMLATIDETGSEIEAVEVHPTQDILVAGCADGSVWVWEASNPEEPVLQHMLRGHTHGAPIRTLNYLGKGNMGLLTTSEEGVAIVWNLTNGQIVHKTKSFNEPIICASVHPTKPLYALGVENGSTYVVHAETGKVLHRMTARGSVESVAWSPCGVLLAVATLEGILEVWHVDQLGGYPRHKIDLAKNSGEDFNPEDSGFTNLVWHPDPSMRCVVVVGKSGLVQMYNGMTGELLVDLTGHRADILDVAMTKFKDPQGRDVARIISACDEGFVKMFTISEESNDSI